MYNCIWIKELCFLISIVVIYISSFMLATISPSGVDTRRHMSTFFVASNVFTFWYVSLCNCFSKPKKYICKKKRWRKSLTFCTFCDSEGTQCSGRCLREVEEASFVGQPAHCTICIECQPNWRWSFTPFLIIRASLLAALKVATNSSLFFLQSLPLPVCASFT